jgi:hypothetical protein
MSKITKELANAGIVVGTKVNGLFAQTKQTVYVPFFDEPETITSIEPYPEDEDMVIVKTKELSERDTIITSEGELDLPEELKQYVISGFDLLRIVDENVDLDKVVALDSENQSKLKISISEDGIDTEFSTLPKELLTTLTPFINYVNANKEKLNDIIDINSLEVSVDQVSYDINTLTQISKAVA